MWPSSGDQPQLILQSLPAHLGVAGGGLNRGCTLFGHVAQVVSHLLDGPSSRAGPVRKVVPEIMESDVLDQTPFFIVSFLSGFLLALYVGFDLEQA
jgi:hypothetical protein